MMDFKPWGILKSPLLQTVVAAKFHWCKPPVSITKFIPLHDQDRLALEISTPLLWTPDQPTVIILHGLGGHHNSSYVVRLAHKILKLSSTRVIRVNFRGCGTGMGFAKGLYHSGRSEDILAAIETIKAEHPESPLYLLGFSLGGNVALKLAGELADKAKQLLSKVIAICPPINLVACAELIDLPENRLFQRYFMKKLLKYAALRHKIFPELGRFYSKKYRGIVEFDNQYTAPHSGFLSAQDYYQKSSSKDFIKDIAVPCHILMSADDPFIYNKLDDSITLPDHVKLHMTTAGGHMGYLSSPFSKYGFRWMDNMILEWLNLNPTQPA
ncbi:MAG: alpha/beta fold hydrolase [Gammaproteobacteria bacterium]|nr:alpha/beta fold hydrolase [Gammaproteobacteria bacterium]